MKRWDLSEDAYLVAALHFAKHASGDTVFGLLIGKGREVRQSIPLFHSFVLAPSLIVGLTLAEEYAKSIGYEVIGAYSKNLPALMFALPMISQKLKGDALGLLYNEKRLENGEIMFDAISEKQEKLDVTCDHVKAHDSLEELVSRDAYCHIADLDEHFVDPKNDFLGNMVVVAR